MSREGEGQSRRAFIGTVGLGAVGLYGGRVAPDTPRETGGPLPTEQATWDMSWVDRLTAARRAVFDCAEFAGGDALTHVSTVREGYRQVYGEAGVPQTVLVARASAARMAFGHETWAKYGLNELLKMPGARNPFAMQLSMLNDRGVTILVCNLATSWYASQMAQRAGLDAQAVYAEVRENLVAGSILQPSGVFAVIRAQEAGCEMLKSS